jgi:hypothetical protein
MDPVDLGRAAVRRARELDEPVASSEQEAGRRIHCLLDGPEEVLSTSPQTLDSPRKPLPQAEQTRYVVVP